MKSVERLYFLFRPFIAIFFLDNLVAGAFIAFITLLVPSVSFLGFVAVIATIVLANFLQIKETYLKEGFYIYNSLLVGMGIGYFFGISIFSIILAFFFGILTFLLTFGLNQLFAKMKLPILSLPFAIVSILFYLASYRYTTLYSKILEVPPVNLNPATGFTYVDEFFRSFGAIVFMPYTLIGLALFFIVFFFSRILAFLAVIGFFIGVLSHTLLTGIDTPTSLYNFNYILIAMALGGVFLVPHPRSYLIALIGVVLSIFVIDATEVLFYTYNLPLYTLPFNTVVLLFLLLLSVIYYPFYNSAPQKTPEESLEYYLSNIYRFKSDRIHIGLPFLGLWHVYQAFDGKWTHKGELRFAYDFVKKIDGKLYANEGNLLTDYYSYGQSVVAPIDGYVVDLKNVVNDNIIGEVNRNDVWGNYVMIKSTAGFYLLIAHLMPGSIKVTIGDYVKRDQIIAKCGNSGYSPLPHIHIQVQYSPVLGSSTAPFVFDTFIRGREICYYQLPKDNEEIENLPIDPQRKMKVEFILDDRFIYEYDGKEIEIVVRMNPKGEFYFDDGSNRLFFYTFAKSFYFYRYEGGDSLLKELFLLAPRVPLVTKECDFIEILPPRLTMRGFFSYFFLSFHHKGFIKKHRYTNFKDRISSDMGEVRFNPDFRGFSYIRSQTIEAKLKEQYA